MIIEDIRKTSSERAKQYWARLISNENKKYFDSNGLIARFMGYNVDDSIEFFYGIHYYLMNKDCGKTYKELTIDDVRSYTEGFVWNYHFENERRYDNSWDVLMPVIDKIESITKSKRFPEAFKKVNNLYTVQIGLNNCKITENICAGGEQFKIFNYGDNRIDATYKTVVKFIDWYNEINK